MQRVKYDIFGGPIAVDEHSFREAEQHVAHASIQKIK